MNGIKVLIALIGATTLWGAFAAEWPEPPYTEDKIKSFVNNDELRIVSQLYGFSKNSPDKIDIYSKSGFLVEEGVYSISFGLESRNEPEILERTYSIDEEVWENKSTFDGMYSRLLWNSQGSLVGLYPGYLEQDDFQRINSFRNLKYFYPYQQKDKDNKLDFSALSSNLPIEAIKISDQSVVGLSQLCTLESLSHIEIVDSTIVDSFVINDCGVSLSRVRLVDSQFKQLNVSNLPDLDSLELIGGRAESIVVDGPSLPNLKTVVITSVDLPTDLSQIQLPEGLTQLYLKYARDNALAGITIPDSVEFIDLKLSELDDYSFLSTAKGLKHLRLRGSSFDQWELLSGLDQLEYLDLIDTGLMDEDVQHLAPLESLKYLSLAGTKVTDVSQLETLQNLFFLNLYETDVLDFNNIPFIKDVSNLGFARLEHYEMSEQFPDHIVEMMKTVNYEEGCNGLKPCGTPAWSIGTR